MRDDIVARLGASPIYLPPLRERIEDSGRWPRTSWRRARRASPSSSPPSVLGATRLAPQRPRARKDRDHRGRSHRWKQADPLRDLPEPIAKAVTLPVTPGTTGTRRSTGPSPTPAQLEELLRRYEGNVADVSRELGKHRAAVWRWIKNSAWARRSSAGTTETQPTSEPWDGSEPPAMGSLGRSSSSPTRTLFDELPQVRVRR